jgi:hypothetical protein
MPDDDQETTKKRRAVRPTGQILGVPPESQKQSFLAHILYARRYCDRSK